MWLPSPKVSNVGRRSGRNGLVAVAIDKDKGSQLALRWATENLLTKGQTIILIHVQKSSTSSFGNSYALHNLNKATNAHKQVLEKQTRELFMSYHCFCTRKDINCFDVVLEDSDVAKAITEYVATAAIENLVLGASRHGFIKFKMVDIPSSVSKIAPDFCTVYVISKTKISSVKNASRLAPFVSPLKNQIRQMEEQTNGITPSPHALPKQMPSIRGGTPSKAVVDDTELVKSPFAKGRGYNSKMFSDLSDLDTDISFISSDRPSTDRISTDRLSGILFDSLDSGRTSRVSTSSDSSVGSIRSGTRGSEHSSFTDFSSSSVESDDVEAEMRRLKLELQRTMEMYSTACKEALSAKQKAVELHRWRLEEERRLEEARLTEESARLTAEQEKAKYKAAMENAQAAQRIAEIESQKRLSAEIKALQESGEKEKAMSLSTIRYRRYSIEEIEKATDYFAESRKVGEGGYGPVYRCYLDHTPVAVKVLRPDAAQGRSQFQREVEVLSCMRHPHMVLLLGACPEYGCLVYEYMANGSLEDRLFRRGNTRPLSWQLRFKIASEIATGLLFLHQTKPEPLVHRDLKPGNILLDQNFVSKISDVGLARLVPPSIADDVTQYRMTSTAGTFCYIDPEYQQTGMLGVKSDVYSLGVMLLQIITAKSAMGLTHHVDRAIEKGAFAGMLDPAVPDWPVVEALAFAKLALQCAELRRKDRPDLGKVVLPELNRLREFAEQHMDQYLVGGNRGPSPPIRVSASADDKVIKSDPQVQSEYSDPVACASSTSLPENLSGNDQEQEAPTPEDPSSNDQEQEAPPSMDPLGNDQEQAESPQEDLLSSDQEQEAPPSENPSANDLEEVAPRPEDPSSNEQEQEQEASPQEDPLSNEQEQEAPPQKDPSGDDEEQEAPPPVDPSTNDQEDVAPPPEDPSINDQEDATPPPNDPSSNEQEQEAPPPEDPSGNDQEEEAHLQEDSSTNEQEQEAPPPENPLGNDQEQEAPSPENPSRNDQEQEAPPPENPSRNDQEQEAPPPEVPSSNDQEQDSPPQEDLSGNDQEQEAPPSKDPLSSDQEQEAPPQDDPSGNDQEQEAPPQDDPSGNDQEQDAPPLDDPSGNDQEQEATPPEDPSDNDQEQDAPPPEDPSTNQEQDAPPPEDSSGNDQEQGAPPPKDPSSNDQEQETTD